jgi:hypothetical protein
VNLRHLTKHKDLCDIVALDIFLNNDDRHYQNLFFDTRNNHYYGIDMDVILKHALYFGTRAIPSKKDLIIALDRDSKDIPSIPKRSTLFLKTHFQDKTTLSTEDIKDIAALKSVHTTLNTLIKTYPPEKIYTLWMDIAKQANYSYGKDKKIAIAFVLLHQAEQVKKFQDQLETIFEQHKEQPSWLWQNIPIAIQKLF